MKDCSPTLLVNSRGGDSRTLKEEQEDNNTHSEKRRNQGIREGTLGVICCQTRTNQNMQRKVLSTRTSH